MHTKSLIILLFLYFICIDSFSQIDSIINNRNISYGQIITRTRRLDSNRIEPSKTFIVLNISPSVREAINKFTYEHWMKLLCDTTTDFAANICLYNMFRKDAFSFDLWETREKWVEGGGFKNYDINYWKIISCIY